MSSPEAASVASITVGGAGGGRDEMRSESSIGAVGGELGMRRTVFCSSGAGGGTDGFFASWTGGLSGGGGPTEMMRVGLIES